VKGICTADADRKALRIAIRGSWKKSGYTATVRRLHIHSGAPKRNLRSTQKNLFEKNIACYKPIQDNTCPAHFALAANIASGVQGN
jgi:hypothetical protein